MSKLFPAKFTLVIEECPQLGWFVTSDAHKGFAYYIAPEEGLPEGLRQVVAALRVLLVAQLDADIERANNEPIDDAVFNAAFKKMIGCL